MLVCGCGKSPQETADERISDKTRPVIMLTHPTEPPRSYIDAAGNNAGEDVELARRIAEKLGRKLVVESVEFAEILPRLKAGTADFAISTITITDARRRDVNFSVPYETDGACFLYRKDGAYPRMSQISMLRIAAEKDTVQDLYLCRHGCDPMRFGELAAAVAALERKELDAVFFDAPLLRPVAERNPEVFGVTPLMMRDAYGIAVDKRRGDILAAANEVIAEGGAK